jgi:hypothetical protein
VQHLGSYSLNFDGNRFSVRKPCGAQGFSGQSAKPNLEKLYVIGLEDRLVYVGCTSQPMAARLRYGTKSNGAGYAGYAWRDSEIPYCLNIWSFPNESKMFVETVEAEVVYLIRKNGQWPDGQTEIHFHASQEEHRAAAAEIFQRLNSGDLSSGSRL